MFSSQMTPSGSMLSSFGHDLPNHHPMHIGQPKIASRVAIRQPLVIESQEVQDRRVQIVHVDAVLLGGEAEVVGGTVDVAALGASAGQPHAEAVVIVVAAG